MTKADVNQAKLYLSDVPTARLVGLALTVPVAELGNELYGRSHAWYSIAPSQVAAIEYIVEHPVTARQVATQALGRAGYGPDNLPG